MVVGDRGPWSSGGPNSSHRVSSPLLMFSTGIAKSIHSLVGIIFSGNRVKLLREDKVVLDAIGVERMLLEISSPPEQYLYFGQQGSNSLMLRRGVCLKVCVVGQDTLLTDGYKSG